MNAICLVIDRLHAGYVGAYGNSWIDTPALDRLACEAMVFDHVLIDTPRLRELYQSYWQGWHALLGREPESERQTLAGWLASAGVRTTLLTDEPTIARHPLAREFDARIEIPTPEQAETAADVDRTQLGRCFTELVDLLQSPQEPFLVWCHIMGMGGAWDAPYEYRERFAESGDPPPPASADVPGGILAQDYDPDVLLGVSQAYAGQVGVLDTCVGALLELVRESPWADETLVALLSARGFPLGEHRRVGPCDEAIYGELVQVPMLIRFPDGVGASARSQAIAHPADLYATLLDWWTVGDKKTPSPSGRSLMPLVRQDVEMVRDRLCIGGPDGQRAIRTPGWYLHVAEGVELFAKPDDRWEVNDVADRCREIVEELRPLVDQYEEHLRAGRLDELPRLEDRLLYGLE